MDNIPYSSLVGSLMYAQTYTRLDKSFVVGMLGRYQSNPGLFHWRAAKKALWSECVIIALYVDDMLIFDTSLDMVHSIKRFDNDPIFLTRYNTPFKL